MKFGGTRVRDHELTDDTARQAIQGNGGLATALLSCFALVFSGLSLYETVLKRANLKIYVPPVVHYARDPSGERELFAIPITIANQGARDAAVTSIRMEVVPDDASAGAKRDFFSAFFIDSAFFARGKGYNRTTRSVDRNPRPKLPFAPISVAGRDAYTGTILFNAVGKSFPHSITKTGVYTLKVHLKTEVNEGVGPMERFLTTKVEPITLKVRLKIFSRQLLSFGTLARMYDVSWDTPIEEKTKTNNE